MPVERKADRPGLVFTGALRGASEPFPHFWEHTVGSGHATLALRADWQAQLKRAHDELGFRYVRFHGILSDDMGTLLCNQEKLLYSFHNADQILDFLVSIQMRPFVELSFMPLALSSGGDTVFHYKGNITPPRHLSDWAILIEKLVRHWVERYGLEEVAAWFFEVWNEPNLKAFWTGTQDQYFDLYATTARAVKKVSPRLQVGGPATAANAWIPEFIAACRDRGAPVDFVSTHHYPTDAFGKEGDDTLTQLSLSTPGVLRAQAQKAAGEAAPLSVYYTEWCTSSNPRDELHDEPFAAAFLIKTILEARGLVKAYSYWTFSDIFEENYFPSVPFHGGFGLLNIHGIAKPAYRAFELLHGLGDRWLPLEGSHPTVNVWAVRGKKSVTVIAVNFSLPKHPIETQRLRVELAGAPEVTAAEITRIDADHCNPKRVWEKMGRPDYPSVAQERTLKMRSMLAPKKMKVVTVGDHASFSLALPPNAIAAVSLQFKGDIMQRSRRRKAR